MAKRKDIYTRTVIIIILVLLLLSLFTLGLYLKYLNNAGAERLDSFTTGSAEIDILVPPAGIGNASSAAPAPPSVSQP